jgi:tetratricopeptide (TPR) repeat protein
MTPLQKLWADVAAAELAGEHDKAIAAIGKVIELTKVAGDGYVNLRLGWLYYLKRDYQLAIQHYATSAIALPRALSPREGLMACYQALGNTERVIESARGIVSIHAANYPANKTLADIYYGKGEYATAALYYRHLATLNPTDLVMVTNLGWCYLQLGQLDDAEQVLNNVLMVSPLDNSARQGISRLQVMRRGQAINQAVMKRLMAALDADGDGELSEQEMAGAAAMLGKLDLDRDGRITAEELQQPPEEGPDDPSP